MGSYISILIGMIAGALTGYFIYSRTKVRARELEAEEAEAAQHGGRRSESGNEYNDDPNERRAINALRRDDDVSLHTTCEDIWKVAGRGIATTSPTTRTLKSGMFLMM